MLTIKEVKFSSGMYGEFIINKVFRESSWMNINTQTNKINYPGPKLNTYGDYREILTSGGIIRAILEGKELMNKKFTSGGILYGNIQEGFDSVGKVNLKPMESVMLEWQDGYIKLVSMPAIAIAMLTTIW